MKKIFIDTEFTGLHQKTTLMSLALVAETDEEFYAEFTDYDNNQVTDWISQNVIAHFILNNKRQNRDLKKMHIKGNKSEVKSALQIWLNQFGIKKIKNKEIDKIVPTLQIWADVPHYDWVLFCNLFEGAMKIPKQIHYMPMDLATVLFTKGVNLNKSRKELINKKHIPKNLQQHNALFDAKIGLACLNKYLK